MNRLIELGSKNGLGRQGVRGVCLRAAGYIQGRKANGERKMKKIELEARERRDHQAEREADRWQACGGAEAFGA